MSKTRAMPAALITVLLYATPHLNAADPPAEKDDYKDRIYIADADGSDMKPLLDLPEYKMQGSPCWSHDGKLIAFDGWRSQMGEERQNAKIIVVNADGSNPRVLGDGDMPSFSPQAHRIAYSRYNANYGVWVRSVDDPDKEPLLLDDHGWSAQWSPDGHKIVYTTGVECGKPFPNLVVFDLVEGTRDTLFDATNSRYQSFTWNFKWSPDSRKIAFRGDLGGNAELAIVDARGAQHGITTRFAGNFSPNFSYRPDGRRILFAYRKDGPASPQQLYWVDPDTNAPPERLPGQDSARSNGAGSFSPDGKKLVMVSAKFGPPKKKDKPAP